MNENWIVVTGASSGIGKELAVYLLKNDYNIILTARRKQILEAMTENYNKDRYRIIPWDLSEIDTLKAYAESVKKEIGLISGLVHSAGIQKTIPLSVYKPEQFIELFSINTFSSMMLISIFSKKKYSKDNASFILISSLAAHLSSNGKGIYAASKCALEGFVKSTYQELTKNSKRLNCVVPGIIKTEMVNDFFENLSAEQKEELLKNYPLGFGNPIDVVFLIEYLLSDKSKWITGQNYHINGGRF